jgi:hypothetical protein
LRDYSESLPQVIPHFDRSLRFSEHRVKAEFLMEFATGKYGDPSPRM